MRRRELLKAAVAAGAVHVAAPAGIGWATVRTLGTAAPFDYPWLKGHARYLAQRAYRAESTPLPRAVSELDWERFQSINYQYRDEKALWHGQGLPFQVKFFHRGPGFAEQARLYAVEDGLASELGHQPEMFDYGQSGLAHDQLPDDIGFAGFRLHRSTDLARDIVSFLGASYFRAVGEEMQYGISARGLAIDAGLPRPEEFPRFTRFWLQRPSPDATDIMVHALLESAGATGAFRFRIQPGATLVMDVDAALYPRRTIERIGIAPLTSMFHFGENDRRMADRRQPEVHDSDGLALWTGEGEWIWRPLANPPGVRFNSHLDRNPRGFGLLQRDLTPEHYQDDGMRYEWRPSLWVEPRGEWGRGSVQLIEIPAADETFDNVVAFWNPVDKPRRGQELLYGYRLHWGTRMPFNPALGRVVATRVATGDGGAGAEAWRFTVDFAGVELAAVPPEAGVQPEITVSRGTLGGVGVQPLEDGRGYRAQFDLKSVRSRTEPVNLRLVLKAGGRLLTETWFYQWSPSMMRSA
ncbi:MAG: glucan biosynthesis protein D [Burkholderiales bacterium]|nr:glucan biosynthesis protein D [Burkholderiales bacterium]